jgi:hypoxanthine-guanine phosphoribosyltransferase
MVPDYVGFNTGDKWLVGMGMDDGTSGHEHFRWHDEILEANSN